MTKTTGQSWTSRKLDFLNCVAFDWLVTPYMFEIAFCIAQHVNEKTGRTLKLCDATIAEKTGGSPRNVYPARMKLRKLGWIDWKRTQNANIYKIKFDKVERTLDEMTRARDHRNERRKNGRLNGNPKYASQRNANPPQYAPQRNPNPPQYAPQRNGQYAPQRNRHLSDTPKEEEDFQQERSINRREAPPAPDPQDTARQSRVAP
jgi:hypothetical protein